jgi:GTP-binding protein
MMCDKKELAKTSAKPGKTQLINYFAIESVEDGGKHQARYLVDLPGYGYAKVTRDKRHAWQEMIADYLEKRDNLVQIFVLIDSRHKPQSIDIEFINRLEENSKPFCIVFTKSDQVSQKEMSANLKLFMTELSKTFETLPGYFVTSALKKWSAHDMLQAIHELVGNELSV